jgi:hypothetical protein
MRTDHIPRGLTAVAALGGLLAGGRVQAEAKSKQIDQAAPKETLWQKLEKHL